jgi:hypothetical protein
LSDIKRTGALLRGELTKRKTGNYLFGRTIETNASVSSQFSFLEKDLDRIARDTLYKTIRVNALIARAKKKIPMMMSRTYKEYAYKWQPTAAKRSVCLRPGLGSSRVNIFGRRLGTGTAIDSRNIRH